MDYEPSAVWHDPVYLPDGSSPPTAAAFNPAHEAELDMLAYLKARIDMSKCVPVVVEFLANGTVTIPADALDWAWFEGCGGGGAGGKGGLANIANHIWAGGGGGGGAAKVCGWVPVVPGDAYDVTIGAGGVGVNPLGGIVGNPGADTRMTHTSTSTNVVICRGAAGGHSSYLSGYAFTTDKTFCVARGGRCVRPTGTSGLLMDPVAENSIYPTMHFDQAPQAGGLGVCSTWPIIQANPSDVVQGTLGCAGADSPEGFPGGDGGLPGTHSGGQYGGGAGGGGGAGPYGSGGKGGNGSNGSAGSVSATAQAGADAAANTGAGGGGGGGRGNTDQVGTFAGADPGDGGSGRFRLTYFRKMQEP